MDTRKGFRFMHLPAELRDMIYIEILAPTRYVTLMHSKEKGEGLVAYPTRFTTDHQQPRPSENKYCTTKIGISLKILRTSKAIYSKARDVFFQKNCLELSLVDGYYGILPGLLYRDKIMCYSKPSNVMVCARFVTIEIGFNLNNAFYIPELWDILGESTKLEKLTLRNGREIDGVFFGETEASLYYHNQTKRSGLLSLVLGNFKYLNNALGPEVQKMITFPGMRLCRPTGLFGNEIHTEIHGCSLIDIAKMLHGALGGELWVNGTMWMKGGTEMDGLDKAIEKIREESKERKRKQIEVLKNEEEREKHLKRQGESARSDVST
ncbi:hypothetical protein IFR05_016156 [Cadophora sp. M221]|nr:hypothetical protein IFR05_016156 [Cadophora sp. M221]